MRPLWFVFARICREEMWSMLRGIALTVAVLAMGIALLGLSGWFIAAAGAAGILGAGALFDVFRPSAAVRFLALGRTAARYGERLLTHDATLRALTRLRVHLLGATAAAPFPVMSRFRGAQVLNRLTADVDALDGVALRLGIPLLAGIATLAGAWALLAWLVHPAVAAWAVLSLVAAAAAALAWAARRAAVPSRLEQAASQAFRARLIDHLRGRAMLAVSGRHEISQRKVLDADARSRRQALRLAAVERRAETLLAVGASLSAAGALLIGAELARRGILSPARATLGFFATLAMAEILAPLRRGIAELGAMRDAARRVTRWLQLAPGPEAPRSTRAAIVREAARGLAFRDVAIRLSGSARPVLNEVTFSVEPGEIVALAGPSGAGKSTLLNAAAGLIPISAGDIRLDGRRLPDWREDDLRGWLGYLPQRSALIGGSIAENLRLARPDAGDDRLRIVLRQVQLLEAVDRMGGLEARLGEGGKGLSGGEARRLALARVLLRAPKVLLLDEPTEGLDRPTAEGVLQGIAQACPGSAVLIAAHRAVERDWAHRCFDLK